MKVLVTGGGGFLGRTIVEQFVERGDEVRIFSRGEYADLNCLGVEVMRGDIRDAEGVAKACREREVVIHTAALAGIWGRWSDYYGVNTLGTKNVLAGCREHEVARLVYTSSPSVTFNGLEQINLDESTPYAQRWLAYYPRSKALAEQMVLAADGNGGLSTCALRPHLIWGPRDPHLIPRLLEKARSGRLRRVGDGSNLVDITYVENAARAHLQAADVLAPGSAVSGQAYFLSQGEPVLCWEWIDSILQLADLPPVRRSIPLKAALVIGAVCELAYAMLRIQRELPMTRFLAYQLGLSHYFDISRAKHDFGYEAEISTAEGMARLARSWERG